MHQKGLKGWDSSGYPSSLARLSTVRGLMWPMMTLAGLFMVALACARLPPSSLPDLVVVETAPRFCRMDNTSIPGTRSLIVTVTNQAPPGSIAATDRESTVKIIVPVYRAAESD